MSTVPRGGYKCFIKLIDGKNRYGDIYMMSHKSGFFEKFKEFHMKYILKMARK